jgi:hypothetical protein
MDQRARAAALAVALAAVTASACGRADAVAQSAGNAAIAEPSRRSPAPPERSVPALPPGATSIRPATLEFVSAAVEGAGRPAMRVRQTFVRISNRVLLRTGGAADSGEWLFTQNPVAPDRVSGAFVDHRARTVIEFEDTDLLITRGLRGWADVLTFGTGVDDVARMRPTGRRKTIAGLEFDQYVATTAGDGLAEVWWHASELIPGEAETRRGHHRTRTTLISISWQADENALRPMQQRYPDYAVRGTEEDWRGHK